MIQFNLLPDVKIEYIKARRAKRLVMLGSTVTTGVTLFIAVTLFLVVNVVQSGHMDDLRTDIQANSKKLQDTPDLNKILTVQNQLTSLSQLHDQKPAINRVGKYLSQLTPDSVSFSEVTIDYTLNTMTIEGSATSVKAVNEFIDTLKFTMYKLTNEEQDEKNAFSGVVLSSLDRVDEDDEPRPVTYEISLAFDTTIFNTTKKVELVVPKKTTTRSVTEKPDPLFETQAGSSNDTGADMTDMTHEEGQ